MQPKHFRTRPARSTVTRLLILSLLPCQLLLPSMAQRTASFPNRNVLRLASPDRHWLLIGPPNQVDGEYRLFLLNQETKARTVLKRYNRSLQVGWNANGTVLYLNDATGSNVEEADLYWPNANRVLSLNELVLEREKSARKLAEQSDHSYLHAVRWTGKKSLLVEFCGDLPSSRFDYLWKVSISGPNKPSVAIRTLSQRFEPTAFSQSDCRF